MGHRLLCGLAALLVAASPAAAATRAGSSVAAADTVAGRVVTVVEEGDPTPTRVVVTPDDVVPLAGSGAAGAPDGARVQVRVAGGRATLLDSTADPAPAGATRATSRAATVHQVYVAPVAPAGITDRPPSAATATSLVAQASDYWAGQTGGRVRFTVADRLPAYTSAYSCKDSPLRLWQEARQRFLSATGVDVNAGGRHLLLALPGAAYARGCSAGVASVGWAPGAGGTLSVSQHVATVYAHELGHNLGLAHAGSLLCTARRDTVLSDAGVPRAAGCRRQEYDDYLEVMSSYGGARATGNLNVAHLADLGLQPELLRTVPAGTSRVLTLAPLSDRSGAVRGAVAPDPAARAYYVQYRTATGADRRAPADYRSGVELHREDPAAPGSAGTLQLDPTPTAGLADLDRVLRPGATFTSASGRVAVTVLRLRPDGATVRVTDGLAPGGTPARVVAGLSVPVPPSGRREVEVRAHGVVTDAAGRFLPRTPLTLQRRSSATGSWRVLARTSTDAHGRAALTVRARWTAYLRLVAPGTATRRAVRSDALRVA